MKSEKCRPDLAAERHLVERTLQAELAARQGIPVRLRDAMAHSLFGGGKRLRPILVLWTHDALATLDGPRSGAVGRDTTARVGAAIEMIHTYSLIHDDLPAMDDDVLRRGRQTCHVAFDEGTAILAGDGLQALAFEVLADCGPRAAELVALAAKAAGPAGMVGGQQRDLDAEGLESVTADEIAGIHSGKTADMIALGLAAGAVCSGAPAGVVNDLQRAGHRLGMAFQGADDVLDVTASSVAIGKTPGKDAAAGKATWVRLEGLERARQRTLRDGERGLEMLDTVLPAGAATDRLCALARFMWQRDH